MANDSLREKHLTYEYCVIQSLLLWVNKERFLHRELAREAPDDEAIRSALRYFKVARNFKGIDQRSTRLRVRGKLVEASKQSNITPWQRVDDLAKKLGKRKVTSAASKLLWLRHRWPYVIYDNYAAVGLAFFRRLRDSRGHSPTSLNGYRMKYEDYYKDWRREYRDHHRIAIESACQQLISLGTERFIVFMPLDVTRQQLDKWLSRQWFYERVFDHILWEIGRRN